ncbi:heme exporter protein CcmD [Thiomicrorhabdus indica]|uniref:heme exporter protein CcmD n=1 Tax=Thiomicrorhabdus indica TaxID=2267253 RepID=UPI00102E0987|nr:heme exporter protein CcmD [Thiomicrorhabdus indica]
MAEFFNMGGYGFYVWGSFGITAIVLVMNVLQPILQHRQALREADDFYSEESL